MAENLPGKLWDLCCLNKKTSKARKKSDSNYLLQGHNLPEISRQKEGIVAPRNNAAKILFGKRIHGLELNAPGLCVLLASEQYNYCGFSALSYCLQFLRIGLEYFPLGDIYYHHPSSKTHLSFPSPQPPLNLLFTKSHYFYSQLLMQIWIKLQRFIFASLYWGRLPCLRELRNHRWIQILVKHLGWNRWEPRHAIAGFVM